MNERIRGLVRQADVHILPDESEYGHTIIGLEKFAELIVQECVRYFNEDYQRDFDNLWREDLSKGIKKHFGVER